MPSSARTLGCEMSVSRTYQVRTYGCQMNMHDSERLAGLLEAAGYQRAAERGRRGRGGLQHLRRPRERRQQAVRQPQPPAAAQARPAGHADRGRRLPGPEGPGTRAAQGAVGRRRVRHAQHRIAAHLLERARHNKVAQVEIAEALQQFPSVAAERPRIRLLPLGFPSPSAATTAAPSASCPSLRGQGGRPQPGDILAEVRVAGGRRRARSHPARPERQRLRRFLRRPGAAPRSRRLRQAAAGLRDASTGWNACGSPRRIRPSSPTTSSRRWRRRRTSAPPCTCRCSPDPTGCCARCGGPTAPSAISASSTGSGRPCRTPPSPPTSSWASPVRPKRTSRPLWTWCGGPASPAAFTFQYSKRPGTPAAELDGQLPKAVVQERYERLVELQEDIPGGQPGADRRRPSNCWSPTGEGRKDSATTRMTGRARDGRLVHFAPGDTGRVPATSSPRWSPGPLRTTSSQTARRGRCGGPGAARPGRPARTA